MRANVNSIEIDREFLEAGIQEMEDYLLSSQLYWPLSTRKRGLPRLTIGGLLLANARLEADGESRANLLTRLAEIRARRQVAWEKKTNHEVKARCRLWQEYLTDYRHNPEGYADAFPQEVRNRATLDLLLAELYTPPAEHEIVIHLDDLLREYFMPGTFVWDPGLQAGFPREVYWYLYGQLKN